MSTLKVTNIEHGSTTDGGIQLDSSGHVTVDGQQLPTAGALSNRNLIINGAMNVAQRGTSSTSTGYRTVDRFKPEWGGVSVTQSQETLSSGSPYDEGFRYFLRLANTSTSTSASSAAEIQCRVEAQDLAQSGWNYKSTSSYVTFSFWVRSSLAGTYYVTYRARDASNNLQHVKSFTLVADTWTKVTHTIPGGSDVVFNNDNGEGLRIMIVPHYGTDFTGSGAQLDAWHDRVGSDYFPDYAQSWSNTASATFDVTGVQLEVGEKATPFEHRSYGDELARCQRYFLRLAAGNMFHGRMNGGGNMDVSYFYPVTPRTVPTGSASLDTANAEYGSIGITVNALSVNDTGSHAATIRAGLSSSGTNGHGAYLKITGDTTVDFSAEL